MKIRVINAIFLVLGIITSGYAMAELDPELAGASNQNESGFFVGAGMSLGQAYATGGSNPGVAGLFSVEPGYVASRDSWGRIEASIALGMGMLDYREKSSTSEKVDMDIKLFMLAKIGYGWSLGSSMFGIFRAGVGPVMADYTAKIGGVTHKSDGTLSGMAGMLGYDILMPVNDTMDIVGGLQLTHMTFDLGKTKAGGVTSDIDEPINLNIPVIYIGTRFKF